MYLFSYLLHFYYWKVRFFCVMSSDHEPDDNFEDILYDNNYGEFVEVEMYDIDNEVVDISDEEDDDIDDINVSMVGGSGSQRHRNDVVVLVPSMNSDSDDDDDNITDTPLDEKASGRSPRGHGREQGGRYRNRATEESGKWSPADRLVEIYVTDDDVPQSLRDEIMSIVEQRETRMRKIKAKNVNTEAGNEALFEGDETALRFDWKSMDTFQGRREQFLPKNIGPTKPPKSAYEAFRQYWDDGILLYIVTETNRYAATLAGSSATFAEKWYETNVHELLILFSFWMMLGIIRMPSLKSCFTMNPLLQTRIFRTMFSKARYENLCRALHFVDDCSKNSESSRLFPIEYIVDHLNSRFQSAYIPKQDLCIDESLLQWKGRLPSGIKQHNNKNRVGIKTYELCESSSGYLWSFFVYAGKTAPDARFSSSLLASTKAVLKLVWPLLGKGYTVFMNDWFNSPILARYLKKHRTDCVGTIKESCKDMPLLMKHCELKEGEFVARHSGDTVIMACYTRKRDCMISTYHGIEQTEVKASCYPPARWKPQVICDYNKNMGGVSRKNQMLEPYLLERNRSSKWNMKLFKRLLNCSILNSRILLQQSDTELKDHLVFRLELVQQILTHHSNLVPRLPLQEGEKRIPLTKKDNFSQTRLTNNIHWPRNIITKIANNRTSRRRCIWCSKRNHLEIRTNLECESCEVPLCLEPCFKLYHTLP